MALQILPPDKLKANARAKVKAFQLEKRKRELEAKRNPPAMKPASEVRMNALTQEEQEKLNIRLRFNVKFGDVRNVKRLLREGADVNTRGRYDLSPLMIAITEAKEAVHEICRILIEAGADVNAREDVGGWTALMFAAFHGYGEIANLLLASGADVANRSVDGNNALIVAADGAHNNPDRNYIGVAMALLDAGADVNARSIAGYTALDMCALLATTTEFARFLESKGAKRGVDLR